MMLDVTARNQSFASVQVYGLAYCRQIALWISSLLPSFSFFLNPDLAWLSLSSRFFELSKDVRGWFCKLLTYDFDSNSG